MMMEKKSTEFYDLLLSLLRYVHQMEERGVSLKYAELDADVAIKVADSISQVQSHPNWLNIAHFELIPTDKISSESDLISNFSTGLPISEKEKEEASKIFADILSKQKTIQIALWTFYNLCGIKYPRQYDSQFALIAYIILEILPRDTRKFKDFVNDWNLLYFPKKDLRNFVLTLFNEPNINDSFIPNFCRLFDKSYVEDRYFNSLRKYIPDGVAYADKLMVLIQRGGLKPKQPPKTTKTKPFMLTIPEPRSIPYPNPIPKLSKPLPVPESLYINHTIEELEQSRAKTRDDTLKKYENVKLFRVAQIANDFVNGKQAEKLKSASSIQSSRKSLHAPSKQKSLKSLKKILEAPTSLPKPTTAAILREEKLIKKKLEEEMHILREQEIGHKDIKSYEEHIEKKRLEEEQERLLEIERKRLDVLLIHEEAQLAKQEKALANKQQAKSVRTESNANRKQIEQKRIHQLQENKIKVEEVSQVMDSVKEAKQRTIQENQKQAEEIILKQKENEKRRELEAKREMERKTQLIRRIRALELLEREKRKQLQDGSIKVDLTETSKSGLLSEMSVAELRERLSLLRSESESTREQRKSAIIVEKTRKKEDLEFRIKKVAAFREQQENSRHAKSRNSGKNSTISGVSAASSASFMSELSEKMIHDPRLQDLQNRLNKKKMERISMKEAVKSKEAKVNQPELDPRDSSFNHPALKWKELYQVPI